MKPIYEIDFSALNAEERVKFMADLRDWSAESFREQPFAVQLLAQTLIFTRWWNSYQYMAPKEPTPAVLGDTIELLWDFQEGKYGNAGKKRHQHPHLCLGHCPGPAGHARRPGGHAPGRAAGAVPERIPVLPGGECQNQRLSVERFEIPNLKEAHI